MKVFKRRLRISRQLSNNIRTKSGNDLCNYQMQRNKVKDVIRKTKADHESSIIYDLKSNPKQLYKYIRQKQKVKYTIGPLKQADGAVTKTNKEPAEALASFFKSVFVHEDIQEPPEFPSRVNDSMSTLVISEDLVHNKYPNLTSLKPLAQMKYILTYYLHIATTCVNLFVYQSFQSGQLPQDWKLANVTPVYKNSYQITIALSA